jgi:hypothetical protein
MSDICNRVKNIQNYNPPRDLRLTDTKTVLGILIDNPGSEPDPKNWAKQTKIEVF